MQATFVETTVIPPSDIKNEEWLILAWGFFWRGLLITAASGVSAMIVGFIVGFIVGIVMAIVGISQETYLIPLQILGGLLGLVIGFFYLILLLKWLLNSDFGEFRLQLVKQRIAE